MAKPKPRGVFEKIPNSGVWWIQFFADGKRHREKVGRKSDAIDLYRIRKAEARAGVKIAPKRPVRGVTFGELFDDARGLGYIANRHPRPGEAVSYTPSLYPSGFAGYSVVAYLPNPSRNGNVIILTGTDSDATSAAAEFLTSEEQLKKFQKTLHVQKFPYFEVLLKTSRLSGTSFSSELLAYRTYPSL